MLVLPPEKLRCCYFPDIGRIRHCKPCGADCHWIDTATPHLILQPRMFCWSKPGEGSPQAIRIARSSVRQQLAREMRNVLALQDIASSHPEHTKTRFFDRRIQ